MKDTKQNYWKCPNCGVHTEARLIFCRICGTGKPTDEKVGPQQMVPSNTDPVKLKER